MIKTGFTISCFEHVIGLGIVWKLFEASGWRWWRRAFSRHWTLHLDARDGRLLCACWARGRLLTWSVEFNRSLVIFVGLVVGAVVFCLVGMAILVWVLCVNIMKKGTTFFIRFWLRNWNKIRNPCWKTI